MNTNNQVILSYEKFDDLIHKSKSLQAKISKIGTRGISTGAIGSYDFTNEFESICRLPGYSITDTIQYQIQVDYIKNTLSIDIDKPESVVLDIVTYRYLLLLANKID